MDTLEQLRLANEEIHRLREENRLLREKIDALARRMFGKSSEKLDPAQMELLLGLMGKAPSSLDGNGEADPTQHSKDESTAEGEVAQKPKRKGGCRWPQNLQVIEERIVPPEVEAEPGQWREIPGEVSEQLDYEPARFLIRRTVRPRFVHREEPLEAPLIAELPARVIEGGIIAPGLIAQILTAKYCEHMPLYRQQQSFLRRYGVEISRQTMANQVQAAAFWLKPIVDLMREKLFTEGAVQIDETPVHYLAPGHGSTKLGYFWVCGNPDADTVFHWEPRRAAECLDRIVPVNFRGVIQCDGYAVYDAFARQRAGEVTLASCLAHVRRKFFEAREHCGGDADWVLQQISRLYGIEKRLREQRAGPQTRVAVRESESKPILDLLHQTLKEWALNRRHLPQSNMGRAIAYALDQWAGLLVCFGDGRLEVDNNHIENAIRPTAIGKKNWLFIGAEDAGETSAIIYTIVESCRRQQIDAYAYLRDVLTRLPRAKNTELANFTPAAWARSSRQSEALARRQAA